MAELRPITREEKIKFYRDLGYSETDQTHIESDGVTSRPWTAEEFEESVWLFWLHPDEHGKDLSYVGRRREAYPNEVEQLDTLWKMVNHLISRGVDVGPEAQAMAEQIKRIKTSIPKYSKPA